MAYILVVDDDLNVQLSLLDVLQDAGHKVKAASNGYEVFRLLEQEQFDLMILDIIMPGISGIDVCRRVRADPYLNRMPILFLTAKGRSSDIAQGLDVGGDDYLVKPLDIVELPARVRALLRRVPKDLTPPTVDTVRVKRLLLSLARPEVHLGEKTILLTPIEHRILYHLMRNVGYPTPIEQLLQDVWGYSPQIGDPQLVRVHIGNLRNKLGVSSEEPEYIHNIHGRGYVIYE